MVNLANMVVKHCDANGIWHDVLDHCYGEGTKLFDQSWRCFFSMHSMMQPCQDVLVTVLVHCLRLFNILKVIDILVIENTDKSCFDLWSWNLSLFWFWWISYFPFTFCFWFVPEAPTFVSCGYTMENIQIG